MFGMSLQSVLTVALITIAVLAMMFPAFKAGLEAWLKGVADKAKDKLSENKPDGKPASANADDIVKQRARELRSACPKADDKLRLRWLDGGYDVVKAKDDYISELEKLVDSKPA